MVRFSNAICSPNSPEYQTAHPLETEQMGANENIQFSTGWNYSFSLLFESLSFCS